jgi:hypothetical protein
MVQPGDGNGYVSAAFLADFLATSETKISRLGKAGHLSRIPNPANAREFLYDLRGSVRGYIGFLLAPRERAVARFTLEKARTQKLMSEKLRLEIAIKSGAVIPRDGLLKELSERLSIYKRRLKAVPARVSGAYAETEESRRGLERLLENEVNDTLSVLAGIFDCSGNGESGDSD